MYELTKDDIKCGIVSDYEDYLQQRILNRWFDLGTIKSLVGIRKNYNAENNQKGEKERHIILHAGFEDTVTDVKVFFNKNTRLFDLAFRINERYVEKVKKLILGITK